MSGGIGQTTMLRLHGSISRSPANRKVLISGHCRRGPIATRARGAQMEHKTAMDKQLPAASIEAVTSGLASVGYIASQQIATAVYLAERIEKPILVKGRRASARPNSPRRSRPGAGSG